MSRILSRIGAFSAGHRLVVASVWIALTAISGAKFSDSPFSIDGAESTTALATMDRAFPAAPGPESGELMLVIEAPDGVSLDDLAQRALVDDLVSAAGEQADVLSASDPFDENRPYVSEDGSVAVSTLVVDLEGEQSAVEDALRDSGRALTDAGFTIELGGLLEEAPPQIASVTEIAGVVIAFIVLLLTFGSLRAAGANMLIALTGIVVAVVGILAWSSTGAGIQSTTLILAIMLGLAVGIDYALLILSRFRDELRAGVDVPAAIAKASGTAGTSVVVAGTTVVIALAGLAIVRIPFITEMGLGAALAVVVAVAMSLTVVPAVLMGLGHKALPRKERRAAGTAAATLRTPVVEHVDATRRPGILRRWAMTVVDRPVLSILGAGFIIALLALPVLSMQTELAAPGGDDPDSSQRAAYDTVSDAFGPGEQNPLIVLFEGEDAAGIAAATTDKLLAIDQVVDVSPVQRSEISNVAFLAVTPEFGPTDARTAELVESLRTEMEAVDGSTVSVTGKTAVDVDVDSQLSSGLLTYLICVVGLSLLLLTAVFRSIVVSVLATVGFLMSLAAGLGVTVVVFQWGWAGSLVGLAEARPLASLVPLIVVGVLFGLAMDYQIFLVSRIHEAHRKGLHTRAAVLEGFGQASPIVVAAACIMMAVFAGFAFSGGEAMVASIGLALTIGVLVDALLVRMILVPAVLQLLGETSWWMPRWLDRILPDVDTEGSTLEAEPVDSAKTVGAAG